MYGVSLQQLFGIDYNSINSITAKTASGGQSFAAILASRMSGEAQSCLSSQAYSPMPPYNDYGSLMLTNLIKDVNTDNTGETDNTKKLLLMLCLMMCGSAFGGENDAGSLIMSLASAMAGIGGKNGAESCLAVNGAVSKTPVKLTDIITNLPRGEKGAAIVQAALTRLNDPYSKSKRGCGKYVDCSYLAKWAYAQAGVSIPSTAAAQAKYCYEKGYKISKSELQPGDLVFWTNTARDSGRWNKIHHVGIYAGNNKVIEAKSSKGKVVIDDLWGENGRTWKIFMYARPYV